MLEFFLSVVPAGSKVVHQVVGQLTLKWSTRWEVALRWSTRWEVVPR